MPEPIENPSLSVVIPSYKRAQILLATLDQLFEQTVPAQEIIVVDQTRYETNDPHLNTLQGLAQAQKIVFEQRAEPSIPAAMNRGLAAADSEFVLFLDDDIKIDKGFVEAHLRGLLAALNEQGELPIAQVGQVLQPGQESGDRSVLYHGGYGLKRDLAFPFNSSSPARIVNCMAGNFCVNRRLALSIGGFDEAFKGAAYRFETEFARRLFRVTNRHLWFWPHAKINHLQWQQGGTREGASHLTSTSPNHSSGDYFYALSEGSGGDKWSYIARRFVSSPLAKFYLRKPWHIPGRVAAEIGGLYQAIRFSWFKANVTPGIGINSPPRKPRLAILMSHPTQHFAPVYRTLTEEGQIQARVFFLAENGVQASRDKEFDRDVKWDVPMLKGYQYEILSPRRIIDEFNFKTMDHARVTSALADYKPDAVWLHGYGARANWRVIFNRGLASKIFYTSDSNLQDPRAAWKKLIKKLVLRQFFARCDRFIAISDSNRAYLRYYGVPERKILAASFPVDIEFWARQKDKLNVTEYGNFRSKRNWPAEAKVFLFVGKLVSHKRAIDLIEALSRSGLEHAYAIIVGDGPEATHLKQQAERYSLQDRVHFTGFANQTELARYFCVSDVLIFPSEREPYGAVAAESLPFGLPIIASDKIGAIGQSIVAGRNALLYPSGDVDALGQQMKKMMSDLPLLTEMGAESSELASANGLESIVNLLTVETCQSANFHQTDGD